MSLSRKDSVDSLEYGFGDIAVDTTSKETEVKEEEVFRPPASKSRASSTTGNTDASPIKDAALAFLESRRLSQDQNQSFHAVPVEASENSFVSFGEDASGKKYKSLRFKKRAERQRILAGENKPPQIAAETNNSPTKSDTSTLSFPSPPTATSSPRSRRSSDSWYNSLRRKKDKGKAVERDADEGVDTADTSHVCGPIHEGASRCICGKTW
eukprot:m.136158 g.136158  ORF g.136158 m.136158 type:complete len:211 (-) comp14724_c0_seq7:228-860(-)